jgi:class 3 adenylate cyclase/tetratricopeptide (TPR) repeat protein
MMADSYQSQIEKLRLSIEGLEAQRSLLGEAVVEPALAAMREQLAALEKEAALEEQAAPAEERRMVTILFFDMVGSTSLAEKLDPEEWRQIVVQLHSTLGRAITAHHGTIAQYLGDGLLAFFGAQEASEADPENAIRAALAAQTAVAELQWTEKVQLRAGIHSGLVVVGELGEASHKEFTASGDAVNLAARLQAAAPPGGILISHDTYRYVRGVFDLTPRPPLTVKGKSQPLQTYLVRRAKPRPFRSVARGVAGVETRTVGREAELQALQEAYLRAYAGGGLVWVQLVSEPGVGKSRLLADLSDWIDLRSETIRLLRARAFPDDARQPFALVRRMWFDRFQIADDAPLGQAEAKWEQRFEDFYGPGASQEAAHALGLLVGLPFQDSPHIGTMRSDPTQVKGRALVVSRELVRTVRCEYPLVILLEDLQWTDAASWEYLTEVFLNEAKKRKHNCLFILGTARPEWCPPEKLVGLFERSLTGVGEKGKWGTLISLAPLNGGAMRELAGELFQRLAEVPEHALDLIIERAEGVPYFAEEIVNWFIDHGILDTRGESWSFYPEKLKQQPLPSTLQHLLLTRLGTLSQPERAALQRGAIFGRHFWTGGVQALGVSAGAEMLEGLQPRGFIEAQPESAFQDDTEWSFHHNLLQEVTYESVLKRERAALHRVAAGWLEGQARQAGRLDEFAGLLGDHYERAGELSAAADWFLCAGQRAMGQGAPREAVAFYARTLELLAPVDRERRWQALLGQEEALGVLCEAEPWKACITNLLELAHSCEDDHYLAEAYLRQAIFSGRTGDESTGDQACRKALETAQLCGNQAIEAKALALSAWVDKLQGNKAATAKNSEEALRHARQLGDDSVLAFVLVRIASCYAYLGDFTRSDALQIEQIELDHRLGNRDQEALGLGNLGARYIGRGWYKQGREITERARVINEALDARRSLAYNLLNLGWHYRDTGDLRKALLYSEEALQEIVSSQDVRGMIYCYLQLGWVLQVMGDGSGASRRFREARELALRHGMAGLVCEATTGMGASAILRGELDEARGYVNEAWNYLREYGGKGCNFPETTFRYCAETFDALGEADNARVVVEAGYQEIIEWIADFPEPEVRQSILENVPDVRAIVEMWERMNL